MFSACKDQCRSCHTADPVADRVKVDPALLSSGKENAPPSTGFEPVATGFHKSREEQKLEQMQQSNEIEQKQIETAAPQFIDAEAEAAERAEEEQLEQERRAFEAAEQRRLEEQHRLEEERRLKEQQEAAFQERQKKEALERAEQAETEAARLKVQKFLIQKGFKGVNTKKASLLSHRYALHAAVEKNNADMVWALLRCKADPSVKNSSKKTAEELAASINKKGSQNEVLAVLRAHLQ